VRFPLLECRNIDAGYGGAKALQGVSLTVRPGEFVGVIGPNGAGKSTLIRVLSGLLRPCAGVVTLEGENMRRVSRRKIASILAVVQQEEVTDFGFTVKEHIALGRAPHHRGLYFEGAEDEAIIREAMRKTRIDTLADRPVDSLSGGERQRARIARALAQRPRILLLDEPSNHLDLYAQLLLMDLLREINREGLALVMVSHDVNFTAQLCARLIVMREGRFLCEGRPREVITEDNLAAAFRIKAVVDANPASGTPRVTPIARL
jgi:iron complex transport system ATP-binding protein